VGHGCCDVAGLNPTRLTGDGLPGVLVGCYPAVVWSGSFRDDGEYKSKNLKEGAMSFLPVMPVAVDTQVWVAAAVARLGLPKTRLSSQAGRVLGKFGRPVVVDGQTVQLVPVVNATAAAELTTVLTRMGVSAAELQTIRDGIVALVKSTGGHFDATGWNDPAYAARLSSRSRVNGGTGAGDEAMVDSAKRLNGALLTDDRGLAAYAARQGTRVFTPESFADLQVQLLQAA
jgi:hypothetical protein